MLSTSPTPLLALAPRATTRRGGPFLFKTLWAELLAGLAGSTGVVLPAAYPPAANDEEPPPPPWSRAA